VLPPVEPLGLPEPLAPPLLPEPEPPVEPDPLPLVDVEEPLPLSVEEPVESEPFGVLVVGTLESLPEPVPLSPVPPEHPVISAKTKIMLKAQAIVLFMLSVSFQRVDVSLAPDGCKVFFPGTCTMYNKKMSVLFANKDRFFKKV